MESREAGQHDGGGEKPSSYRAVAPFRTLVLELNVSNMSDIATVESCYRSVGMIHASTVQRSSGAGCTLMVSFVDSRDAAMAEKKLAQLPAVAEVIPTRPEDPAHILYSTVLVLKRLQPQDDALEFSMSLIGSMLKIFGPIVSSSELPLPDDNSELVAYLFEYASAIHAQAAVDAIGDRPGTTFSLHLADTSGAVPAPADIAHMQLQGHTSEHSESSPFANSRDRLAQRSSPQLMAKAMLQTSSEQSDGNASMNQCIATTNGEARAHPVGASMRPPQPGFGHLSGLPFDVGAGGSSWPGAASSDDAGQNAAPSGGSSASAPKSKRRADELTAFDAKEAAAGGPRARTTIMVRNIPCRWTAEEFLSVLKPIIGTDWDLLYMPCKTSEVANSGYAFLNFESSASTLRLFNAMHGRHWPNTRSGKVCEIRYARIQGRQLLSHLGSNEKGGAAAFRGYLAYPSGGHIIVHGPDTLHTPPPDLGPPAPPGGAGGRQQNGSQRRDGNSGNGAPPMMYQRQQVPPPPPPPPAGNSSGAFLGHGALSGGLLGAGMSSVGGAAAPAYMQNGAPDAISGSRGAFAQPLANLAGNGASLRSQLGMNGSEATGRAELQAMLNALILSNQQ